MLLITWNELFNDPIGCCLIAMLGILILGFVVLLIKWINKI
jgi:hypothetical protein